ncbi:MAG: S8 family serine peptidase [Planctomycetota bacterium]|jgi:predicted outer membrane repeat protein
MLTKKMIVGIAIAVLLCWAGSAQALYLGREHDTRDADPFGAASMSALPAYEAGQLIVKFKEPVASALERQLSEGKPLGSVKLSPSLDLLAGKYKAKNVDPLIKNFKARRRRIQNLKKKDKASLTTKEKHFLRRLNRAPQGVTVPDLGRIYKLQLGPGQLAAVAVAEYDANPDVEYAELNYLLHLASTEPNDPNYYPEQWGLHNAGQSFPIHNCGTRSGTSDADIDAPEAWDIEKDANEIVVAVIDSGVDYNHADLAANMWTDANGYYGYDFYSTDNDPMDEFGHGTHCAGIIAADTNNNLGIAGVSWNAKIMAVKIGGLGSIFPMFTCLRGVEYAVENGADVLSCSWGAMFEEQTHKSLNEVIDYAYSQGVVIVASAGNLRTDTPSYPAAYDNVIGVAATNSNDHKAAFSNYGDWVDIAAPGQDILSLRAAGTDMYTEIQVYTPGAAFYPCYDSNAILYIASGTSMACPHVSGLAALCLSEDPNLNAGDVRLLIKLNADDLGNPAIGEGRINAYSTLIAIPPNFPDPNQATLPDPCDDANSVSINTYLSWTPDELASSHDVYIGTDFNDVNDANTTSAVFQANVVTASFDPAALGQNTLYYWRIDERNYNVCTKGEVWSFTTRNGSIIYVDCDASAGGDGLSWANAFNRLEDALAIAVNDEIWVAEGTYIPDTNDRSDWFAPPENTSLYGGFAGTETSRDQRNADPTVNITILSGDINQPNDMNDNCYHVVMGNTGLVLDRFTITRGYANLESSSSSPTTDKGAGIYNADLSCITISNCTFTENTASYQGGAIYNGLATNVTVTNCTLSQNRASNKGGGLYSFYSVATVTNCTFTKNSAGLGGGAYDGPGYGAFINCQFSENSAGTGGGLYWSGAGSHAMANCTFSKNQATYAGGFCGNAILAHATNCIFWGSQATQDHNDVYMNQYTVTFRYCDIRGSGGSGSWDPNFGTDGGGNIDQDPCFADADANDFHLSSDSPCINAGDPNGNYTSQTDIDGHPRTMAARVDIGADEFSGIFNLAQQEWYETIQAAVDDANDEANETIEVGPGTYYETVDFDGNAVTLRCVDPNDWRLVAATIIDGNDSGTVVLFESGEDGNSVLDGFTVANGNGLYGGGIYCDTSSPTIRNCVITDSYAVFGGGMEIDDASPTVTNCVFTGNTCLYDGAGMCTDSASPTVTNCLFYDNAAVGGGGGLANWWATPTIINCTFTANSAYYGGGVFNYGASSTPLLENCIFWGDQADGSGDEVYNYDSADPNFSYCDIEGCGGSGGAWDPNFGTDGGGNIDSDPNFVDSSDPNGNDNVWATCDDGLRIESTSPCKDEGDNNAVPQDIDTDIKGSDRIINGDVDMGAYEYDSGC